MIRVSIVNDSSFYFFFIEYQLFFNKISLKTNLERNPSNFLYVFILSVNLKNLVFGLHVLIISFVLAKF